MLRRVARSVGLVLVLGSLIPTSQALAHCPGNFLQRNVYGDRLGNANGISALIPWTDPTLCNFSSGVSVTVASAALKWVQVGWWKNSGSVVRGYWEFQGPGANYDLDDFAITAANHVYKAQYATSGAWWAVFDGGVKRSHTTAWIGFVTGDEATVQGESKGEHNQIGKMAPAALLISAMTYLPPGGAWTTLNITTHTAPSPYGIAEPSVGQMQIWTNAH